MIEETSSISVLQNILNSMDAYIYVSDINTDQLLFINDKMKAHFNLPDDVLGKTCWQVLQAGFSERCGFCPIHRLIENPDDTVVWEEHNTVTGHFYRNEDRFIDWTTGKAHVQHSTDITKLKIAEDNLTRRLQQQEIMVEISQSFITDDDIDTKINNAIKTSGEFMGISKVIFAKLGKKGIEPKHKWQNPDRELEDNDNFDAHYEEIVLDMLAVFGRRKTDGFNLDSKNKREFLQKYNLPQRTVVLFPLFIKDKLWGMLIFKREIDDPQWSENDINLGKMISSSLSGILNRNDTEQQLKKMSSVVESSPQYISCIDKNGNFEYINPAVLDITGYTKEELYKKGMPLIFDKSTVKRIKTEILPTVNREGELDFEIPLIRKDGSVRLMSFSTFLTDGNALSFGSIATDITELRKMENDLIAAKEQAEKSSKAKSEFLSNMSHEMRTPLNAVIGMTNIAKKTEDYIKKDYCLDKINIASNHLLGVINDILDMSKIEANKLEILNIDFNFEEMLQKIIEILNYRIDEKKQILLVNLDPKMPAMVYGDEQHLSQVITNLLANAVKFTHEKGQIELFVDVLDGTDENISVSIRIKDNGIGISEEQQKKLFKSFEQADSGISRKFGGTGLGLAISKNILELMGGKIQLKSSLGKGSEFSFVMDLKKSDLKPDTEMKQSHNKLSGIFSGKRILFAEDIEINREIVSTLLDDTGIEIDVAENGKVAISKFKENSEKYDLILMDIQMPEIDGLKATRKIRSMEHVNSKTIPIIAMTANAFQEDIIECMSAGMDDHMGKPIDFDVLISTLKKYLQISC